MQPAVATPTTAPAPVGAADGAPQLVAPLAGLGKVYVVLAGLVLLAGVGACLYGLELRPEPEALVAAAKTKLRLDHLELDQLGPAERARLEAAVRELESRYHMAARICLRTGSWIVMASVIPCFAGIALISHRLLLLPLLLSLALTLCAWPAAKLLLLAIDPPAADSPPADADGIEDPAQAASEAAEPPSAASGWVDEHLLELRLALGVALLLIGAIGGAGAWSILQHWNAGEAPQLAAAPPLEQPNDAPAANAAATESD